jgi:hypothetical protein
LIIHMGNEICIYKAVQLRSKFQHTGTWSADAWPPYRLCYHPEVFSLHLHLIALASLKEKLGSLVFFYFLYYIYFFFSSKNLVRLELCKSESVCSFNRHFRAFSLSIHDNVRRRPQPLLAHHLPWSWVRSGALGWGWGMHYKPEGRGFNSMV